ncbi:MAG: PHP domain-containing protein [Myxococcales bacterium]|nr:PHP domain-containing protein [Myxococcales bacterium]
MRLDLHCHSVCSDGSLPPAHVAAMAAEREVSLFCLTDHDTMAGYGDTLRTIDGRCVVLRGMELSCREYDRTIHLLLYGLQPGPGLDALQRRLDRIAEDRRDRIRRICAKLAGLGVALDPEPILVRAEGRVAGRPDVARALVAAGICTSPREAFDRFLKDGGPADAPIERLGVAEGLALARHAGGRVSLAHPHTLGHPALVGELFSRFQAAGLEGIEAFYGRYGRVETDAWLRLAERRGLVPTGGSDFHGDLIPEVARLGWICPSPMRAGCSTGWGSRPERFERAATGCGDRRRCAPPSGWLSRAAWRGSRPRSSWRHQRACRCCP